MTLPKACSQKNIKLSSVPKILFTDLTNANIQYRKHKKTHRLIITAKFKFVTFWHVWTKLMMAVQGCYIIITSEHLPWRIRWTTNSNVQSVYSCIEINLKFCQHTLHHMKLLCSSLYSSLSCHLSSFSKVCIFSLCPCVPVCGLSSFQRHVR